MGFCLEEVASFMVFYRKNLFVLFYGGGLFHGVVKRCKRVAGYLKSSDNCECVQECAWDCKFHCKMGQSDHQVTDFVQSQNFLEAEVEPHVSLTWSHFIVALKFCIDGFWDLICFNHHFGLLHVVHSSFY